MKRVKGVNPYSFDPQVPIKAPWKHGAFPVFWKRVVIDSSPVVLRPNRATRSFNVVSGGVGTFGAPNQTCASSAAAILAAFGDTPVDGEHFHTKSDGSIEKTVPEPASPGADTERTHSKSAKAPLFDGDFFVRRFSKTLGGTGTRLSVFFTR